MGELKLHKEESLRIGAPNVYKRMIEIFKKYNIHPYDAHGTVINTGKGFDITIKFPNSFSSAAKATFSFAQVKQPDSTVTDFFEQAAEQCKNQLITDYYKMIKL